MPGSISRRGFIKLSAALGATSVVSGCKVNLQQTEYLESYTRPPEEGLPGENVWYASVCRQCPAGCGILVRVSEGRARKIEGNPIHPLNHGKLCARGQAGLQVLYHPDRLRQPVQQARRASAQFEAVAWQNALGIVAQKLANAAPGSVAFVGGYGSTPDHVYLLARRLTEALAAPSPLLIDLQSMLEGRSALAHSTAELFGNAALPIFDIANADVVFSFGANFLESWLSPVAYGWAYGQMRGQPLGKRGYFVQFEPRLSMTAASADEWIPVRSGAEGLLALALGKIIIEEQILERPVAPELADWYADVDALELAHASDVSAEEISRLARKFAAVERPVAIPGGQLAGHTNAQQALAAVQALNLLAGRTGQPGGVYLTTSPPGGAFDPPPVATLSEALALIERMRAGQVEVLMIHGANLVFELPPSAGFLEALAEVPFVVSFSSFVDESALHADLILPDHTYLEGWGYHGPSPGADRPVVGSQQPVVSPLWDTRATADVLLSVAQEAGGAAAEALPWPNEVAFLREYVGRLDEERIDPEAFWVAWKRRGGWWQRREERIAPQAQTQPARLLAAASPEFSGDEELYPFYLLPYPSLSLGDGRGASLPWLQETPDPMTTASWNTWVEINPQTAAKLGVRTDDIVTVASPHGQIEAVVYVYPAIRPDTVAIPIGQGHLQYGRYAAQRGASPIALLGVLSGEGGNLAWAATRVNIIPTGRRYILARLESDVGVDYAREAGAPGL